MAAKVKPSIAWQQAALLVWGTVQHGHLVAAKVYHKVRCALQSLATAELMGIGRLHFDLQRHCMLGQETYAKGGFVPLACSLWKKH